MELDIIIKNKIEQLATKYTQSELHFRAEKLSNNYSNSIRDNSSFIKDELDALTYAIMRMPATFSSVSNVLSHIRETFNGEISSCIDVGSGTGSGLLALNDFYPHASLTSLEREVEMINLSKKLIDSVNYINVDYKDYIFDRSYDLILSSYSLNELDDSNKLKMIDKLWKVTNKIIVIVEPGTPEGYSQIMKYREYILSQGGYIVAPCCHSDKCNIEDGDWCNFSTRVSRSKLHKLLKGGEAPFEDEKFIYLVMSKTEIKLPESRIIRHPYIGSNNVSATLCTASGLCKKTFYKKDKELYKKIKKSNVGDIL